MTRSTRPFYRLSLSVLEIPFTAGSIALGFFLYLIGVPIPLLTDEALIGALVGVVLYWALVTAHHLGHAWAAARTGYPMTGIEFGRLGLLARSIYPDDEPKLPPRVHIRRALGGPIASGLLAVISLALVVLTFEQNRLLDFLLIQALVYNLILSVGALAPFPGLDGGTILYRMRQR